jgi:Ca2+-binding EF-hand superfamily protein
LEEAFKSLDDDKNSYMTINELSGFLTKIGVYL